MAEPSNIEQKFVFLAARGHYGDGYGAPENYNHNFWWKIIIFVILKIFIFFDVFQLRDWFWTLPDGSLDPLDR